MYIYQADTYCDDCGSAICEDLVKTGKAQEIIPWDALIPRDNDGLDILEHAKGGDLTALASLWDEFNFDPRYDTARNPCMVDEHDYDSGDYPKYGESEPTDCPDHCACGAECLNAIRLDDETKIGDLLSDELTEDGITYVMDRLRGDFKAKPSNIRSLVVLYWMDHISNLHYPKDLYTVKVDSSDDDPFSINLYVQGPYAEEWADSVGAVGGSSWESCDGPTFVHDHDIWYPGIIEEWEAEGWDLDLSDYSEPDDNEIAVGRHMSDCEDCRDHRDFEKGKEHYEALKSTEVQVSPNQLNLFERDQKR